MNKLIYIFTLTLFVSCGQPNSSSTKNLYRQNDSAVQGKEVSEVRNYPMTDKTIKFLWLEKKKGNAPNDTISRICINEEYCKTISDPERAVLGLAATFINSECAWDGAQKADRSNLKCKILSALDLGYQCSDKHLGFLRKWFKNDKRSLDELIYCSKMNSEAKIQESFEEIMLQVEGDEIVVKFIGNGMNLTENYFYRWIEADYFILTNDNLELIDQDKEKIKSDTLLMADSIKFGALYDRYKY